MRCLNYTCVTLGVIFLSSCATVSNVTDSIQEVQVSTRELCSFVPAAASVSDLLAVLNPGLGAGSVAASTAAQEICKAIEIAAARGKGEAAIVADGESTIAIVSGVPIAGYFVR